MKITKLKTYSPEYKNNKSDNASDIDNSITKQLLEKYKHKRIRNIEDMRNRKDKKRAA